MSSLTHSSFCEFIIDHIFIMFACSLVFQSFLNIVHAFFQETSDHMLFPNPGSGMIHEQHLQFFHFLGSLLAKVWYLIGCLYAKVLQVTNLSSLKLLYVG